MSRCKLVVAFLFVGLFVAVLLVAVEFREPSEGFVTVLSVQHKEIAVVDDPSKVKFNRLRTGMTLADVQAVIGPVGVSYSSDTSYEYYIVKGKDGWSRIWVEQGKVYRLSFDPTLSVGD